MDFLMKSNINICILMLITLGCSFDESNGTANEKLAIEYCVVNNSWLNDRLIFDLKNKKMLGGDVANNLDFFDTKLAVGFIDPFPFAIPKISMKPILMKEEVRWRFDGFEFKASSFNPDDKDLILIQAYETPEEKMEKTINKKFDVQKFSRNKVSKSSSILFSFTEGVISFKYENKLDGEDIIFGDDMKVCSGRGLFAKDFEGK